MNWKSQTGFRVCMPADPLLTACLCTVGDGTFLQMGTVLRSSHSWQEMPSVASILHSKQCMMCLEPVHPRQGPNQQRLQLLELSPQVPTAHWAPAQGQVRNETWLLLTRDARGITTSPFSAGVLELPCPRGRAGSPVGLHSAHPGTATPH